MMPLQPSEQISAETPPTRWPAWVRNVAGALIFAVFLAFVEWYIGWNKLLAPWRDLSPLGVIAAIVVVFASYGVRELRLYDYFRHEMRGAYPLCLKLFLQHNMLNNLLPMRSGELSFPLLMSRYFGVPAVRSVPALGWFRLLDLHTLLAVAIAVTTGFPRQPMAFVWLALWMPLPYLAFFLNDRILRWLGNRHNGKLARLAQKLMSGLPRSSRDFWINWFWTLVNWLVKLAALAWVLLLFMDATPVAAWLGVIAGDLTSVLPVHGIAGVGTYEAGVMAALVPFGIGADQALTADVNLHLFVFGCAILGGLASLALRVTRHASRR